MSMCFTWIWWVKSVGESGVREKSEIYKIIFIQILQLQMKHSSLFSTKILLEPKYQCDQTKLLVWMH